MSTALVCVENLSKHFLRVPSWLERLGGARRQVLRAVEDVSFAIAPGRTLALVGESGCGKSTVARCVAGLHAPTAGRALYRGRDMRAPGALRAEVQMVFQDPYASLNPRWRVGRIVGDPIRALKLEVSASALRDRVATLLEAVGLSPADARKYPHEFSGGQRQRIAIARAVATRPAFVICDEPTSALDVSVQAQILNMMRDLQESLGLTFLFISHNLAVVDHMADEVGVMYLGRLVELTPRAALFARPLHPYTRLLLAAMPRLDGATAWAALQGELPNPMDPPPGCAFHPRCPHASARCRAERPEPRRLGAALVACHHAEDLD
jgi:peptide/nickel transport system ATP-binding protein